MLISKITICNGFWSLIYHIGAEVDNYKERNCVHNLSFVSFNDSVNVMNVNFNSGTKKQNILIQCILFMK